MKLNITTQKNLLAFSAGVDSTALFFMLLEQDIPFDIAIVNYNLREQSKEEVTYALSLALEYNKQCFVHDVKLDSQSNFEKNARDIRYEFFEEIIEEYSYETLLTAHQLNDKLEWFLMQLSKGAGLSELLGLQEQTQKEHYRLLRPLLNISKECLEEYLIAKKVKYFYDQSNDELKYRRNFMRHEFANKFLKEFESGIKHSFEYLQKDLHSLHIKLTPLLKKKKLEVFEKPQDENKLIRIIDNSLKKRGYLLSHAQREEILRQQECVIDHFAIAITPSHLWIAPVVEIKMPKEFKEKCRIARIPKKIRPYLFEKSIEVDFLSIL
ncbi:tRNA lysidine(34) synthetase TilS [Candidatus Marinarcus aquaticus]|uniref:tRNA(Ile)-lysidine synthase n=1 Tax=Candidatus Marinarcus aquaticus TaxID=2044504 RepID=A0A4Q0XP62_9BACT|nr:tRNA lysidine(34) synthetase TilS [Candidatus Marinarcus aquaticus]RXJ56380.1 tRNA lysidine(34) synthetase TilS [Candidatus Marinarcus aquaticus]